jgi:hypothetical protein
MFTLFVIVSAGFIIIIGLITYVVVNNADYRKDMEEIEKKKDGTMIYYDDDFIA